MKIEVTYNDLDGCAPKVSYRGATLLDGIKADVTAVWSLSDIPTGNPWFDVVVTDAPAAEPEPEPAPMTTARAALLLEAEGLGLRVDGRWSDATLLAKIEEARG